MRLTSLKLRGFSSAFPGVIDLPLRDIEPGLVAVVGPNGEGKTTLLEATPGAIFRRLPARNGMNPVDFAIARDSFLDLEYDCGDVGVFRSLVSMDARTRKTDAILELVQPDGSRVALNDGKVSTYDAAIAQRFPSFDLFINSAFAAQGRGGEFTSATPSKRKDLFVEFLALKRLLTMAKAAGEAAALCEDARLRLSVQIETLERDTVPALFDALTQWQGDLEKKDREAEARKTALAGTLANLEARAQLSADAPTAYASAQLQVLTYAGELTARRQELATSRSQRAQTVAAAQLEASTVASRRDATLKDIDDRLAGNQRLQQQGDSIRAAVVALITLTADLATLRQSTDATQAQRDRVGRDLEAAERAVSAFTVPKQELARAKTDSALLVTVPCGGTGEYAACKFLLNAKTAEGRISELEVKVAGITAAIEQRDAMKTEAVRLDAQLTTARATIADRDRVRADHERTAKYADALAESNARVAELTARRAAVVADADREIDAVRGRLALRVTEFEARDLDTETALARLQRDHQTAQQDLEAAAAGNSQATQLQDELVAARLDWDTVTRTLAEVASGRTELVRRRAELTSKQARLVDVSGRLAGVEAEWLDWQFFAKALGKGGLPDLEIDAAGPSISALTNTLLLATYGPRFSLELVTQVEKADGSGFKDEFTVRVLDNDDAGGWRDISELSGGEKVIVQEALMLAISCYVNERSPMPIRTLWRDETGAALDPEHAVQYVAMLRKARELGGFVHVFFISHDPNVVALADTQIRVGGGQAHIVTAPFDADVAA